MSKTMQIRHTIYLILILIYAWTVESAEVTKEELGIRLHAAEEVANYTARNVTSKKGVTITIVDSNMSSSLQQSALASLVHNSEIYSDPAKILWYSNDEMNAKHPYYIWLGAVDFSYVLATGAFLSVRIDNHRVFMFGVKNC